MNDGAGLLEEIRRDIERAKLHAKGRDVLGILRRVPALRAEFGGDGLFLSTMDIKALLHVVDAEAESHFDTAERYIACRETLEEINQLIPFDCKLQPPGHAWICVPDALMEQIKRLTENHHAEMAPARSQA